MPGPGGMHGPRRGCLVPGGACSQGGGGVPAPGVSALGVPAPEGVPAPRGACSRVVPGPGGGVCSWGGACSRGCLLQGGAWSQRGVSALGGYLLLGGCLIPGGVPGGYSPRLLLRAVRILLECILVWNVFAPELE